MTREDAQSYLAEVGARADGGFPLLEAALACAAHEDPSRDPGQGARLRRRSGRAAEGAVATRVAGGGAGRNHGRRHAPGRRPDHL
ncbi:MAG: hypothetical protein WDM85_15950 [Caulobacteraceae bacterium]